MNDHAAFRRSLRFWALHVPLIASANFCVAVSMQFNRPQSFVGMVGGILVFIFLYATIWNSAWFRRRVPAGSRWDRALIYGARMRSVISVLAIVGAGLHMLLDKYHSQYAFLTVPLVILAFPDVMSGFGVGLFTEWCIKNPLVRAIRVAVAGTDAHERNQSLAVGDVNSLLPTFCMTLLQGVLLSLYLLLLSLVALGVMRLGQLWKLRRTLPSGARPALT